MEEFLGPDLGPCLRCPPTHFTSHAKIHSEFRKFCFLMQILNEGKENIGPNLYKKIVRQGASLAASFYSCHTDPEYLRYLFRLEEANRLLDLLFSGRIPRNAEF